MTDDAKSSKITHTEKSSVQIFTMVLVLLFTMVLPKIVMLSKMISVFVLSEQVLSNLTEVLPLFATVAHHGVVQDGDGN